MNIAIVANGVNNVSQTDLAVVDFVIAVDNGAAHCYQAGRTPDVVIGDLDSVDANTMQQLQIDEVSIQQFPAEKDYTDLQLALRFAVETYPDSHISLYAVTGGRDDMTMANILLLAHPEFVNADIVIHGEQQKLQAITKDKAFKRSLKIGTTISLIPLTAEVILQETQGLKYALHDDTLYFANTRSLCNEVVDEDVEIHVDSGILLVTQSLLVTPA